MAGTALLCFTACSAEDGIDASSAPEFETVSDCRNGGPKLAGSGMCRDAAIATLNIVSGEAPLLPENCSWELQETAFAADYLIYLAASCDGKTSKLGFAGGARTAQLYIETSAIGAFEGGDTNEWAPITIIGSDPEAPTANLLSFVRAGMEDEDAASDCIVRSASVDGWPEDAFVVDEASPRLTPNEPRFACGPYGYTEDSTQYWRVFDNFSWFFDLGQDAYQDFDPRSLTLITPPTSD